MLRISRFSALLMLAFLLTSCALLGLENECAVIYEQNLELSKPPVVPTTTSTRNIDTP